MEQELHKAQDRSRYEKIEDIAVLLTLRGIFRCFDFGGGGGGGRGTCRLCSFESLQEAWRERIRKAESKAQEAEKDALLSWPEGLNDGGPVSTARRHCTV